MIVESFVDFDYEITLLTVRHSAGTTFLQPIGTIRSTETTGSHGSLRQ
ncbi:protein containing ATP-grasp fold, ATP-dependent carboxylate-amine ligase-type domain protein [gut metagenome]|uniref:Protein containing ATP-grasp fold, ATP-dependent carboxylate-amine ligase-type domain protein n=1 Tax=gut metagenome TaxID=749906 RepID=J9G562_9ZZZZ